VTKGTIACSKTVGIGNVVQTENRKFWNYQNCNVRIYPRIQEKFNNFRTNQSIRVQIKAIHNGSGNEVRD
jgi:hypothetical protein